MMKFFNIKFISLTAVLFFAVAVGSSCSIVGNAINSISNIAGLNETGTVIVKRAWIRSSYAVVAADLLEVKRGQTLDILEEIEFEKVHWYRVRAHDEDKTEGWIEAQNLINGKQLDKSKKLAEEDKDSQAQATGQLRAVTNLRLSPEQSTNNILYKLENGAVFEIISWKYVPKIQDVPENDDVAANKPTAGGKSQNAEVEAAKQENKAKDLDEVYDIWYKVRLDPSISPAPGGWLFGRQVELQVPSDIIFHQNNARKFISWQRLDNVDGADRLSIKDKDAAKGSKPGSWVVLARSNNVRSKDGNEPAFDAIQVLGFDKYNEEHYTAYRLDNVVGDLPLKVEGSGDNRSFTVMLRNAAGQAEEKRFTVVKDQRGRVRVTAPPDIYTEKNAR